MHKFRVLHYDCRIYIKILWSFQPLDLVFWTHVMYEQLNLPEISCNKVGQQLVRR